MLLRALGTEEVGADSSVLGLWGEAVRGTGPSLVYPVNSHLQGKDTHRKGSPSVRLLTAPSFSPEDLKSQARRVACSYLSGTAWARSLNMISKPSNQEKEPTSPA